METSLGHNLPAFTVSELAQSVKITLEGAYGRVRVRGEVSGFKRHYSGHAYFSLKDESALIAAVSWKGLVERFAFLPEDGMELIALGRLTTYGGRSQYQLVVESIELAGEGALLKLLEQRKQKLAAEGVFDGARKKPLPFLPEVIGVITSPTGAVIRDILHRLADRLPRHVIVWPVAVQGDGAAKQIEQAIVGFQTANFPGMVRPDLLILARGGGSLEDLWCFNEENVVRAVANCGIPIISAVGHETDTTLVDFAADQRAPTPTAAAEMAVPVRRELLLAIEDLKQRFVRGASRRVAAQESYIAQLKRFFTRPERLLEKQTQVWDDLTERLPKAMASVLQNKRLKLAQGGRNLRSPAVVLNRAAWQAAQLKKSLDRAIVLGLKETARHWQQVNKALDPALLTALLKHKRASLEASTRLLETLSYKGVLARGFAYVTTSNGKVVSSKAAAWEARTLNLAFYDGQLTVAALGSGPQKPKPAPKRRGARAQGQPDLFS